MDTKRMISKTLSICVVAAFTVPGRALGGDLNPPPGPITPTMKTLTEIEPRTAVNAANTPGDADSLYRITKPGAYYLTGNLHAVGGKHGIEIAASGVSVDLMAFELVGTNGALDGITADSPAEKNIAIRDGSVCGWGGKGIDLSGGLEGVNIEHILAADNTLEGIMVPSHSVVQRCIATGNGASGFLVLHNAAVESCIAKGNGGDGIRAIGIGGTIKSCASAYNTDSGIYADNGWTIVQCSTSFNGANGIETIYENTILDCTATANSAVGIWGGRLVANCTASANQGDGILAIGTSVVRDNCCKLNAGAGVHVTGGDVRVDGNNVTYNSIGFDVDMPGNLIVRNSAAENSANNYDIVAGNRYGQVIDLTVGGAPPAVLGSGSTVNMVNTTNPWANFSY